MILHASGSITFSDANLQAGRWAHITLTLDGTNASLLVNNAGEL